MIDDCYILGASFELRNIRKGTIKKDYNETQVLDAKIHKNPNINYMIEVLMKSYRVGDEFEVYDVKTDPEGVTEEDNTDNIQFSVLLKTEQYLTSEEISNIIQGMLCRYMDSPNQM